MKKYLIFLAIFIALYLVFQLSISAILTAAYSPDTSSAMNGVILKIGAYTPTLSIIIAALIAYFLSQKLSKTSKARTN